MDYKDYYATLGIPADADEQTIRSAFRRLARVHHPDVAEVKQGATERFKEINEAYTVLSDPDKRRTYDLFRTRYERYQTTYQRPRPEPARPASSPNGPTGAQPGPNGARSGSTASGSRRDTAREAPQDTKTDRTGPRRTQTRTFSEEDMERLFRGFMWAYTAAAARSGERSGSTASSDFSDFFEALFGNRRAASSSGRAAPSDATEIRPGRDIEVSAQVTLEEAFRGTTRTLTYGDGRKVEVTIPTGVSTGSKLRVRGQGERLIGRPIGDLYMTIEVQPHPVFTREGDDLKLRVAVPFELAASSGEIQVPTMERPVQLRIPAGTHSGQSFRLRGQGMPNVTTPASRGDLIAVVDVLPPPRAQGSATNAGSTKAKQRPFARRAAAQPRRSSASIPSATSAGRVRQALGLALTALSLLVLTAQALIIPASGWLWVATVAVVLLAYGVAGRSLLAAGAGLLVTASCVWLAAQAALTPADILRQAWPLVPAALGIGLLSAGTRRSTR